jgi:hypothetical protein
VWLYSKVNEKERKPCPIKESAGALISFCHFIIDLRVDSLTELFITGVMVGCIFLPVSDRSKRSAFEILGARAGFI